MLVLYACLHENIAKVVPPHTNRVVLNHFNRFQLGARYENAHTRKRLSAAPADSQQQGMALRLPEYPCNSSNMLASIHKENELHGLSGWGVGILQVVLLKIHFAFRNQFGDLALEVMSGLHISSLHKIAKDYPLFIVDLLFKKVINHF